MKTMDRVTCSPAVTTVRPVRSSLVPMRTTRSVITTGRKHRIKCRCPRCKEPESLRWVGKGVKILVSNLCHVLGGLCAKCVGKDVGLEQ